MKTTVLKLHLDKSQDTTVSYDPEGRPYGGPFAANARSLVISCALAGVLPFQPDVDCGYVAGSGSCARASTTILRRI